MQIIRDSREQKGHTFAMCEVDVIVKGLKCGDYTTTLLHNKVAVERKADTAEIYGNLCNKVSKARFYRELDKLKALDHAILVFEFPESHLHLFPEKSGLPKFKDGDYLFPERKPWWYIKVSAKYLRRCIHEVRDYGINIQFCEDKQSAEDFIFNYLKNLEAEYERNVST